MSARIGRLGGLMAVGAVAIVVAVAFMSRAGMQGVGSTSPTAKPGDVAEASITPAEAEPDGNVAPPDVTGPEPPAGESRFDSCQFIITTDSLITGEVEVLTRGADAVVIATVKEVGQGRYNTSGEALTRDEPVGDRDVYRPMTLSVDSALKGDAPSELEVRLLGGTVGCDTYSVDSSENVVVGTTYAFLLNAYPDARGVEIDELSVAYAWQVTGGKVHTPMGDVVGLAEFAEQVDQRPPPDFRPPR